MFPGQLFGELLFVVGEDLLPILLDLIVSSPHRLQNLSPPLRADEEREWNVLISVNLHLATSEVFEELVDSSSSVIFASLFL